MTKTENYQLPQWEAADPIKRADFNAAMEALDAGIAAAQAAAETAQSTAEELPYAVGTFVGTGDTAQDIVVGFKPSVVLIFSSQWGVSEGNTVGKFSAYSEAVDSYKVTMTETGFHVAAFDSAHEYPDINYSGTLHQYIAFR